MTMIRSVLFSAMITVGALAVIFSLTINLQVDKIINGTNLSIATGVPIEKYRLEIMALMSGGKLLIVPLWYQISVGAVGCLLAWIGIQGIIFDRHGIPYRAIFTKNFWIKPQASISYDPYR